MLSLSTETATTLRMGMESESESTVLHVNETKVGQEKAIAMVSRRERAIALATAGGMGVLYTGALGVLGWLAYRSDAPGVYLGLSLGMMLVVVPAVAYGAFLGLHRKRTKIRVTPPPRKAFKFDDMKGTLAGSIALGAAVKKRVAEIQEEEGRDQELEAIREGEKRRKLRLARIHNHDLDHPVVVEEADEEGGDVVIMADVASRVFWALVVVLTVCSAVIGAVNGAYLPLLGALDNPDMQFRGPFPELPIPLGVAGGARTFVFGRNPRVRGDAGGMHLAKPGGNKDIPVYVAPVTVGNASVVNIWACECESVEDGCRTFPAIDVTGGARRGMWSKPEVVGGVEVTSSTFLDYCRRAAMNAIEYNPVFDAHYTRGLPLDQGAIFIEWTDLDVYRKSIMTILLGVNIPFGIIYVVSLVASIVFVISSSFDEYMSDLLDDGKDDVGVSLF